MLDISKKCRRVDETLGLKIFIHRKYRMIPVISIVGRSGSGKTTLIEKVVASLQDEGLRVAVIKHTRHHVDGGDEGKDSWRYRNAGAAVSLVTNDRYSVAHVTFNEPVTPIALAGIFNNMADLVIIEGYRDGSQKKIEVIDDSIAEKPLYRDGIENIIALVTDGESRGNVPVFKRDDVERITGFLKKETGF